METIPHTVTRTITKRRKGTAAALVDSFSADPRWTRTVKSPLSLFTFSPEADVQLSAALPRGSCRVVLDQLSKRLLVLPDNLANDCAEQELWGSFSRGTRKFADNHNTIRGAVFVSVYETWDSMLVQLPPPVRLCVMRVIAVALWLLLTAGRFLLDRERARSLTIVAIDLAAQLASSVGCPRSE